jgi:CRP-like cAMP-binding protein
MRCYLMQKGHIAAVEFLEPGPDEVLIEQAKTCFRRHAGRSFDGFEVWDGARRLYVQKGHDDELTGIRRRGGAVNGEASFSFGPRNHLLSLLSDAGRASLVGLERVPLEPRQVLESPGQPISSVYFVASGLVSLVGRSWPNHQIEVGMIGSEGMTGTAVVLGDDRSVNECIVQAAGEGWRIPAPDLRAAMARNPALTEHLLRYVHAFMMQITQTALANGRGRLAERLARCILMWLDRTREDGLAVTHEFLSLLLGVRRSGVTVALHMLESRSLIRASRTVIRVLDREGLQAAANGLYGVAEAEYDRLMGPVHGREARPL